VSAVARETYSRFAAVAAAVALLISGCGASTRDDPPAPDPPAQVLVGTADAPSPPIPSGFVGIALELPSVPEFAGTDPAHPDPVLLQLIRNLTPGQSPILRLGGDSTDYSWWPTPGVTKPTGVTYALTRRWMRIARGLAHALGAHLIIGVNWAAGDPALTITEADAIVRYIGTGPISDLELGNEPGYYGHLAWYFTPSGQKVRARPKTYTLASYLHEYERMVPRLPALPMAGPGDGNLPGVAAVRQFVRAAPRLGLVTMHRYPLIACSKDPARHIYPSTTHLLERFATAGMVRSLAPYVQVARAAGLEYRLDEMNSVSCRGAPVSRTFASALWAVDELFQLARIGVSGVNFNTFTDALYEPFGVTDSGGRWTAEVRPMYYGMLMFTQAAPAGSRLLALQLHHGAALRAWATRAPDGVVHVVLINDSLTEARSVTVAFAGSRWQGGAALTRLTAPSVNATTGVSLGGQVFAPNTTTGMPTGLLHVTMLRPSRTGYTVPLAPGTAAMLTLNPAATAASPGR
jgi:hypothetical protein